MNELKVCVIEPGGSWRYETVANNPESFQQLLGGSITHVACVDLRGWLDYTAPPTRPQEARPSNEYHLYINEESKLKKMAYNAVASALGHGLQTRIAGTAVLYRVDAQGSERSVKADEIEPVLKTIRRHCEVQYQLGQIMRLFSENFGNHAEQQGWGEARPEASLIYGLLTRPVESVDALMSLIADVCVEDVERAKAMSRVLPHALLLFISEYTNAKEFFEGQRAAKSRMH